MIGGFLERLGQQMSALGYLLRNPGYAEVRRTGGAHSPILASQSAIGRGGEVLYFDVTFLNNSMANLPV